jgi:plasmid stabilization system protein ParE
MKLSIHPMARKDVDKIIEHYQTVATPEIAAEFSEELDALFVEASDHPLMFASKPDGLRRANLRRFPRHFLFRVEKEVVRVLVVRHDRRDPSFGLERK